MENKRVRVTTAQRQKLIELVTNDPQLISGKFTSDFTYKTGQSRWQSIANILNSIPGVQKDWKMWRKTWQDIRAKTKSRQAAIVQDSRRTGGGPPLAQLNIEEQQVLAVIEPMDIAGERSLIESAVQIDFQEVGNPDVPEECSIESSSILTQSPPPMILLQSQNILTPNINNSQNEQTPSGIQSPAGNVAQSATNSRRPRRQFITNAQRRLQSCVNATQLLSEQGTEKIQIKREYMSMKREYYTAKLKIMNDNLSVQKEQLNVLRNISTTLSTWKK